jgi:hypothetical protein
LFIGPYIASIEARNAIEAAGKMRRNGYRAVGRPGAVS